MAKESEPWMSEVWPEHRLVRRHLGRPRGERPERGERFEREHGDRGERGQHREQFDDSAWFRLNIGRRQNARGGPAARIERRHLAGTDDRARLASDVARQ